MTDYPISQEPARLDLRDDSCVKQYQNRLDSMSQEYARKIIGEEKNTKLAICSAVSRTLPKKFRFSLMILNQTATGKSHFINSILEPIKENGDVLSFTDLSEAYMKRKFDDVNGKIIKIEQAENKDDKGRISLGRLKHLMTDGELVFGLAEKTDKTNTHQPKEFKIRGYPIIFTTVTDQNIDPETENRFLIVELDETDDQTKRITRHQLAQYSGLSNTSWDPIWLKNNFDDLAKASLWVHDIVIPFASDIESLIPSNLSMRRDLPKILSLTCVIAFMNYKNRDKFMIDKPEHILTSVFCDTEEIHKAVLVATLDDYIEAISLSNKSMKKSLNKINQKSELVYHMLKEISNKKEITNPGVTLKELVMSLNFPESTIRFQLKMLQENGYVTSDEALKEHRYFPQNKVFSTINTRIDFSQEKYEKWIQNYLNIHEGTHFVPRLRDEQNRA